jgi:hypothetical protein
MIRDICSLILQEHEFARAPYPNTWIEIDFAGYLKGLDGRDTDKNSDSRVGYFINFENTMFFSSETQTSVPDMMPYFFKLHRPISFEEELTMAQDIGLSRLGLRQAILGDQGLTPDWFKTPEATNFCRSHTLEFAYKEDWSPYEKQLMLESGAGSLKQGIALLLLLTRPGSGVISLSNQERRHSIIKGKQRVLAPHHKVTMHLAQGPGLKLIKQHLQTGQRHRYHSVKGHWCQTRKVRKHCEHDWQPIDKDHYECAVPGCWAKRWWKKNHNRGDISLGSVTKEYGVTK